MNHDVGQEILRKQKGQTKNHNSGRTVPRTYKSGDIVYKLDKQIKSKNKRLFKKEIVAKNNRVTVARTTAKRIHKPHGPIITIRQGPGRIINGNFKIIDAIDLAKYNEIMESLHSVLQHRVNRSSILVHNFIINYL